jgi:mannose-6-phosphate isomerase
MSVERARAIAEPKPWGVSDLAPWRREACGTSLIGEVRYERAGDAAPASSLLLKLLFTAAPLSIQVHPTDDYAKSIGLPNGKTEAWYVLSASPDAKIALGLKDTVTREKLRRAIDDRSISSLVDWRAVKANDAICVPAGTIHAIGEGIVIAEIQQRSDATFRLFDHGRARALHTEEASAAADLGVVQNQAKPFRLSGERTLLAATHHFVFERIVLPPGSTWKLDAERETWLLVFNGIVGVSSFDLSRGEAMFAEGERVDLRVGRIGAECLVAYTGAGGPLPSLLERMTNPCQPGLSIGEAPRTKIGAYP